MPITKNELISFLKNDVAPALGCTEPVCVALCAANAAKYMTQMPERIQVTVNPNIYKNGMSAGIPNFHSVGLDYAAALGAYLQNPEKKLELLSDVTKEVCQSVEALVSANQVSVTIDDQQTALYVRCDLINKEETCSCVIRNAHTNVVSIVKNGESILSAETQAAGADTGFVDSLLQMKISELRALVDSIDDSSLDFMMDGVLMNERLADYSLDHPCGVGIGQTLRKLQGSTLLSDDLMTRILLKVAAAAENRLDGCPYPTMSSSGAGTKGLVVILPISETAKALGASKDKTVKALAFGHLINRYINAHIGKLAPMCSCAMASSTAACAAMTWLLGGDDIQIGHAIRNMTGTITGMICDGGKVGCALKVASSSLFSVRTFISRAKLCNSFKSTLNASGIPGSEIFSPLTILPSFILPIEIST